MKNVSQVSKENEFNNQNVQNYETCQSIRIHMYKLLLFLKKVKKLKINERFMHKPILQKYSITGDEQG